MQKALRAFSPMGAMAALLLLTILELAFHGNAQAPPPGTVSIYGFNYEGDGCPSGTAEGVVSDDGQALTVMFSSYTATTDKELNDRRKTCILSIQLNYPPGYYYTLGTFTVRGYAKLDAKVKGTVRVGYHISGRIGTGSATHTFWGPFDNNFEETSNFENEVSSECGRIRNLNINSEVRVHPGNPPNPKNGIMTIDSQDLKLTQIYGIEWKQC